MPKKPTAKEQAHMARVAELPCIACGNPYVEVHHCRIHTGMGVRPSHYDTISLCLEHHRGNTGIHLNKKEFEKCFGTQSELLEKTKEMLK